MKNNLNINKIREELNDQEFINHVEKYYVKNNIMYIKFFKPGLLYIIDLKYQILKLYNMKMLFQNTIMDIRLYSFNKYEYIEYFIVELLNEK